MDYEIVRYSPELRDQVIALDRHLISPDPGLNAAYFRWKHEENPYVAEPIMFVALQGDRAVGKRAFQGARWALGAGGATASWPCICDLVVDPEHRGQHLFQKITAVALPALAAEGHRVFLNWSASPISYFGYLKTGWRLVGPYAPLARETPGSRLIRTVQRRAGRLPLAWRYADRLGSLRTGFESFDRAWSAAAARYAVTISAEPDPAAMAKLVAATEGGAAGHERDRTYYGWRFGNPVAEYRFLFWGTPDLDGFLVLHAGRFDKFADLSIVDWAAASPEMFDAMIAQLVRTGGYDSLTIWSATLSAQQIGCFTGLGFRFADNTRGNPDYRPGMLAYVGDDTAGQDLQALDSLDSWTLRMVYSDYY